MYYFFWNKVNSWSHPFLPVLLTVALAQPFRSSSRHVGSRVACGCGRWRHLNVWHSVDKETDTWQYFSNMSRKHCNKMVCSTNSCLGQTEWGNVIDLCDLGFLRWWCVSELVLRMGKPGMWRNEITESLENVFLSLRKYSSHCKSVYNDKPLVMITFTFYLKILWLVICRFLFPTGSLV